ncbi:YraN family protein [Nibricoccus sp. IMCC34717]|uniref:YraN family protein n=1 Tax=Nibricoccus sp. IMCC34717 TaxID=3034021 RepID=UPI00384C4FBA
MGDTLAKGEPANGAQERAWVGWNGETWAALHLQGLGYRLWARNWRNPHDEREEIDVIARDGAVLVFVEVRTRRSGSLVPGAHSLTVRKKRALRRAIRAFLRGLPAGWQPATTRCDLVEVAWRPLREPEIRHFEGISLRTPQPFR